MTNTKDATIDLMNYMSDLSEVAYSAGWMMHLEYALWQAVIEGPRGYGHTIIEEAQIAKLKELSHQCGGWVVFDDAKAETFVPLEQWLKMYEAWAAKNH